MKKKVIMNNKYKTCPYCRKENQEAHINDLNHSWHDECLNIELRKSLDIIKKIGDDFANAARPHIKELVKNLERR